MAFFNRTEIGLKETGTTADVPNNPTAKLMYYMNCVCSVLNMDDDADMNRLRNFQRHYLLSQQDKHLLVQLCIVLNPKLLLNKCFFLSPELCGDSANKFYNIETVKNNLLVAGNVLIGGRQRRVTSIMTFKMGWIERNWEQPIKDLAEEERQEELRQERIRQERLRQEMLRQERLRQERLREERLRQQRMEEMRRQQESSTCNIL